MLRSFRAMHGLDYVALRYFNVYGPRMDVHGLYTEVLVRWMERIDDGLPPLIFGDGCQTMDFVFTTDIARANVLAASSGVVEGVYNVARGEETSLLGLAEALLRVMGSDLPVEHGPERGVNGVVRRLADTAAAERDLGFAADDRPRGGPARSSWSGGARSASRSPRDAPWRCRDEPRPPAEQQLTRINVMQPWLGEEEVAAVSEVLRSGWVAQGPRVARVRGGLRRVPAGRRTPWRVSSCTTALHLALVVAGVGPGDEVVVPSFSFVATANAPTYVGATPVFADVDPATGNLTPATIATVVTPRTRAVIAVDQGGVPLDLRAIRAWCDPLGITVVEDAACAAGSTAHGRPGRRRRRRSPRGPSTRASCSPPARAACSPRRAPTGPSAPAGCASTR